MVVALVVLSLSSVDKILNNLPSELTNELLLPMRPLGLLGNKSVLPPLGVVGSDRVPLVSAELEHV